MKDLYELGTRPPPGTVPEWMYASVIRPDRYGDPVDAFRTEVVAVPPVGRGQVAVANLERKACDVDVTFAG